MEWAAEALLNNGDGTYGGNHNFYIYDQGAKGFVYLPNDTDATFEWMSLFDLTPYDAHPIYWWANRAQPAPPPTEVWLAAMGDPAWRQKYVDAIADPARALGRGQLQGWIDTWSQQIADAVAPIPTRWATPEQFRMAVGAARETVAKRRDYLQSFVDCDAGRQRRRPGRRRCPLVRRLPRRRPGREPGRARDLRQRHRRRLQRRHRRRVLAAPARSAGVRLLLVRTPVDLGQASVSREIYLGKQGDHPLTSCQHSAQDGAGQLELGGAEMRTTTRNRCHRATRAPPSCRATTSCAGW